MESDLTVRARNRLTGLYQEESRAYHGISHIDTLLSLQRQHAPLVQDALAVTLAIWFHDAIYDTTRHDNEEQSAQLAEQTMHSWSCPPDLITSVARKVRATHRHEWTDGDPDTAVFLDFDLGILAAPTEAYERYAQQVALEYAWVPESAYRAGRAGVLQAFLDRPKVYFTPALGEQWEARARVNLARELAQLTR